MDNGPWTVKAIGCPRSNVREQAEAHRFAWSYWEFNAGFGVYDPNANAWRDDLLKALIP